MKFKINTKKHGPVTFFSPNSGGYIWVNLNGQPGTLGWQICDGGGLMGSTLACYGTAIQFETICRRWWGAYLRNHRDE